ncbi:MAG TPA: hypothetical protein PK954_24115 [Anaerolineales bacterium]|nr:hypothetical protein [Anaerolineales bacterium]
MFQPAPRIEQENGIRRLLPERILASQMLAQLLDHSESLGPRRFTRFGQDLGEALHMG